MQTKNTVHKTQAEAKQRVMREAHALALRANLPYNPAVRAILMLLPPALRATATVDVSNHSNVVRIYASVRNLDSFKDKALTSLLSKFMGDEWRAHSNAWTLGNQPNMDYTFTRVMAWDTSKESRSASYKWLEKHDTHSLPKTFDVSVTVCAYVKGDSELCRIEERGMKEEVVSRPIRVIRCGDTEVALDY